MDKKIKISTKAPSSAA